MTTTLWKIPQNCTFRIEDDGTGFAYHADTDGLHPLNPSGALLMRELSDGAETDEELFERFWPEVEVQVRACVRGDIQAFLQAMRQRHCLQAFTPEDVAQIVPPKGNGGGYAPPQVDDFGRAGLNQPTVAMAQTGGNRPKAGCMNGGTPGGSGKTTETSANIKNESSDIKDTLSRDFCQTSGSTPETGPCNSTGFDPVLGTCSTGSSPVAQCVANGLSPESGTCNPMGHSPIGADCEMGASPLNSFECLPGDNPAYTTSCDNGSSPIGYGSCESGTTPSGVGDGEYPWGYCGAGSSPEDANCNTGSSPLGTSEKASCHESGLTPAHSDCGLGQSPLGDLGGEDCTNGTSPGGSSCAATGSTPSGGSCSPAGTYPHLGACTTGTRPSFGQTTGGWACNAGTLPTTATCVTTGSRPQGTCDAGTAPPDYCNPTGNYPR